MRIYPLQASLSSWTITRTLAWTLALGISGLSMISGCAHTPATSTTTTTDAKSVMPVAPRVPYLQPGQQIQAVIVEPAGVIKQRREAATITANHHLALKTLGTFDTTGKSLTQLEQDILGSFNRGNRLRGTVRLTLIPPSNHLAEHPADSQKMP